MSQLSTTAAARPTTRFRVRNLDVLLSRSETPAAVAVKLGVCEGTILRWRTHGLRGNDGLMHKLPFFRVGAKAYIRRIDLANWLRDTNAPAC